MFDLNKIVFTSEYKCHSNNILNIQANKEQTRLFSISLDNCIKVFKVDPESVQITQMNTIKLTDSNISHLSDSNNSQGFAANLFSVINSRFGADNDYRVFNLSTIVVLDASTENIFLLSKTGAHLVKLENMHEPPGNFDLVRKFEGSYDLENATTIEIWNASTCSILLIGSSSGSIRIFKLLHNL